MLRYIDNVSIVMCYYDQPKMLMEQMRIWNSYPQEVKDRLEIVIVDDASPRHPLKEDMDVSYGIRTRVLRVLKDKPWNQNGARNIGANEASYPWLFMGGLDHIIPSATIQTVINIAMEDNTCVVFGRKRLPGMIDILPAKDIYVIWKDMYWKVGGYNEVLSGYYGLDREFHSRLGQFVQKTLMDNRYLIAYTGNEISDASITWLDRDVEKARKYMAELKKKGPLEVKVLSVKYKKVFDTSERFENPEPEPEPLETTCTVTEVFFDERSD